MPKVIVGMSGGVDSSVTAHLLKQQGYDVEGVSFLLYEARNKTEASLCCSLEARDCAAGTAKMLGISHRTIDLRAAFIELVVEPFVDAYRSGLTPNPCILCNKYIKFPQLLKTADQTGAEFIATGHYAKIENWPERGFFLKKGRDERKDQSYFLYVLDRMQLSRLFFPLGELTKDEVRAIARSLGLPSASRPESQEICFIENNDYVSFIRTIDPDIMKSGPVIDGQGRVIGTHKGVFAYTIGQRKGLGSLSLEPRFVTKINAGKNTVHVGSRKDAEARSINVKDINWIISNVQRRIRADVKIRSMMKAAPATVDIDDTTSVVCFDQPQWAPAPGQSAVFYDGDIVLGGGTITAN